MPDERLHRIAETAHKEVLRTHILRIAETVYPKWLNEAEVFTTLERTGFDTYLNELIVNAHYLAEKGLLRIEKIKDDYDKETQRVQLTAKGIDFLEGRLEEIGLASPDLID
jgi:hypothetical protein